MGFYLRKSINVGPFRFNLSNSGVGVSAGVKGLRFGVSPRGNYIHMGRGGLYYRATLPRSSSDSSTPRDQRVQRGEPQIPPGTHAPLQEIESAHVGQIVDTSSVDLLNELNQKRQRVRLWPFVAVISVIVFGIGLSNKWPNWVMIGALLLALVSIYIARSRDILAKTVVLFYNFDVEMENTYEKLHSSAERLAGSAATWHIEAEGKVYDRKYHAGASNLVRRKKTFVRKMAPPYVKANIETIAIGVGRQTLHFFPDRVLIYDPNGVGAVGYRDLRVNIATTRFIESDSPPRDAKVVDKTWKYVNKSGGPDRRFKGNSELPICLYEEISLSSQTGLNEVLQFSQCGLGKEFAEAITLLGKKLPIERENGVRPAELPDASR